jgi:hypothetical protein
MADDLRKKRCLVVPAAHPLLATTDDSSGIGRADRFRVDAFDALSERSTG